MPDAAITDLRLLMLEWCPCCRDDFMVGACPRYKTHGGWLQGLTSVDSRELNTCARRLIDLPDFVSFFEFN